MALCMRPIHWEPFIKCTAASIIAGIFEQLLRLAYPKPSVKVSLPSAGRISFVRQAEQRRYCLHLLYAQPAHRGSVDVIEDIPPIYDTHIQLRVPGKKFSVHRSSRREISSRFTRMASMWN